MEISKTYQTNNKLKNVLKINTYFSACMMRETFPSFKSKIIGVLKFFVLKHYQNDLNSWNNVFKLTIYTYVCDAHAIRNTILNVTR